MNHETTVHQLNHFNGLIHLLLDDLKELLATNASEDDRDWALSIMKKVAEHLQQQFELEEEDGYLEEVLEEFPNWHPQVEHLQQEHRLLQKQFNEIYDRLAATSLGSLMSHEVKRQLKDWIDSFRQHQERENRLIQEALCIDLGVGD